MTEVEKNREISSVYEELKGVLDSISEEKSWFDDEGFSSHANNVIKRVGELCPEITDINNYLVTPRYSQGRGGQLVQVIPTIAKIKSLIGRLNGYYSLDKKSQNMGHTFIQNQQTNIDLIVDLRLKIENHIKDYSPEEPERKFLEELKESVSTAKTAMDLLRLVIETAKRYRITLATLLKIFWS